MKSLLTALAFTFVTSSAFASTLNCNGTEPFWSAEITDSLIRFSSPGTNESLKITSRTTAAGFTEEGAFVVKTKYTSSAISMGSCSDGMSEHEYTHTIVMEKNGQVLAGCCDIAK